MTLYNTLPPQSQNWVRNQCELYDAIDDLLIDQQPTRPHSAFVYRWQKRLNLELGHIK